MKRLPQTVQIMNMVMIRNAKGEVLVLDKVKREGWEGLTFPGGKVEPDESYIASVRREALEETGLRLGEVQIRGFVSWVFDDDPEFRQMGILFSCDDFEGEVHEGREGRLFWSDYREFLAMEPKSDSMNEMLEIYEGRAQEVVIRYRGGEKVESTFY